MVQLPEQELEMSLGKLRRKCTNRSVVPVGVMFFVALAFALRNIKTTATTIAPEENRGQRVAAADYFLGGSPLKVTVKVTNQNHPSTILNDSIPCIDADITKTCCVSWNVNMDDWWLHRPDWQLSLENDTHQCFQQSTHSQLDFLRELHSIQWNQTFNCSQVKYRSVFNEGFSASLMHLMQGFMSAYLQQTPFQITRHWEGAIWNFAGNHPKIKGGNYTNVTCASRDPLCYFLPISHCKAPFGRASEGAVSRPLFQRRPVHPYMKWYMSRPQQWLRRRVYLYLQEKLIGDTSALRNSTLQPLVAFHVRRTDVVLEYRKGDKRQYFPLQDYLTACHAKKGDSIILFTDDETTIEELALHPDINFIYIQKGRFRGSNGGFSEHVPSGNPMLEVVAILAEFKLATLCDTLVHTRSGFATLLQELMRLPHPNMTTIAIDESYKGHRVSEIEFMAKLGNAMNATVNATVSVVT
jgi:hypothetical protein